MDERIKQLLEKNLQVTEESLTILKKLHRDLIWRRLYSSLKIILIMAVIVFGFLQLQPYLNTLTNTLQRITEINKIIPQ